MSNLNTCEQYLPDVEDFLDALAQTSANLGAAAMCPLLEGDSEATTALWLQPREMMYA